MAPRASTFRMTDSSSGGSIWSSGRRPIQGKASCSSRISVRSACPALTLIRCTFASHSRTTNSKLPGPGKPDSSSTSASRFLTRPAFTCLRSSLGSLPTASNCRASSRLAQAVLSGVVEVPQTPPTHTVRTEDQRQSAAIVQGLWLGRFGHSLQCGPDRLVIKQELRHMDKSTPRLSVKGLLSNLLPIISQETSERTWTSPETKKSLKSLIT